MLAKDAGYSLITVIITVLITSILAYSAFIDVNFSNSAIEIENYTSQLAQDLRYVQALAMARNRQLRLNLFSDHYTITDTSGTAVPHPMAGVGQITLPAGMTLSWLGLPNNYVIFDGQGKPYIALGSPLTLMASVTLSMGGDTSLVTITPETGRVTP